FTDIFLDLDSGHVEEDKPDDGEKARDIDEGVGENLPNLAAENGPAGIEGQEGDDQVPAPKSLGKECRQNADGVTDRQDRCTVDRITPELGNRTIFVETGNQRHGVNPNHYTLEEREPTGKESSAPSRI